MTKIAKRAKMHDIMVTSVSVFMGFFAIMNPIANTAVFVGMTGDFDERKIRVVALKALITAFGITSLFCLLGKGIFELFGITLPALRLAGGILVFMVGYNMITSQSGQTHKIEDENQDIAISPLAIPILAGPGTIATAMNFSASGGIVHIGVSVFSFGILCLITYFCFIYGSELIEKIGKSGIDIATKLMGLILCVIGMQMLIQGIQDVVDLIARSPH